MTYNFFCFLHHLILGNPKGCFGNSGGKIVYLNAIKLFDADLYRREFATQYNLSVFASQIH
mgnify:CR=1 FL=1